MSRAGFVIVSIEVILAKSIGDSVYQHGSAFAHKFFRCYFIGFGYLRSKGDALSQLKKFFRIPCQKTLNQCL